MFLSFDKVIMRRTIMRCAKLLRMCVRYTLMLHLNEETKMHVRYRG